MDRARVSLAVNGTPRAGNVNVRENTRRTGKESVSVSGNEIGRGILSGTRRGRRSQRSKIGIRVPRTKTDQRMAAIAMLK
jgi:hypothetical protein